MDRGEFLNWFVDLKNRIIREYFMTYGRQGFGAEHNKIVKNFINERFMKEKKRFISEAIRIIDDLSLEEAEEFVKDIIYVWVTTHEQYYKETHSYKAKEYRMDNELIKQTFQLLTNYGAELLEGKRLYDVKPTRGLLKMIIRVLMGYSLCAIDEGPLIEDIDIRKRWFYGRDVREEASLYECNLLRFAKN